MLYILGMATASKMSEQTCPDWASRLMAFAESNFSCYEKH